VVALIRRYPSGILIPIYDVTRKPSQFRFRAHGTPNLINAGALAAASRRAYPPNHSATGPAFIELRYELHTGVYAIGRARRL